MLKKAGEEAGEITMMGDILKMIRPNEDVRPQQSKLHQIVGADQLARLLYVYVEITKAVLIKPNALHQVVQRLLARGFATISDTQQLKNVACSSYPISNVRANEWQYFRRARGNLSPPTTGPIWASAPLESPRTPDTNSSPNEIQYL